jgi:hypothetical protein
MDYKQARRITSIYTQKLNSPMQEIEAINKVIVKGGFTEDIGWKMLSPEAKDKVLKSLQNRMDAQMVKLEGVIAKLEAALTTEP